jgi:ornithine cyclodeaminase
MSIIIDSDSVLASLDVNILVEALRTGHTGAGISTSRCMMEDVPRSGEINHFIVLPAWRSELAFGAKLVSVFPTNEQRSKGVNIHSTYLLFNGKDGSLLCLIRGENFTRYKTAADSALGAAILSRADAQVLTLIGAGAQAEAQLRLFCAIRPSIKQVNIWNRTASKARYIAGNIVLKDVNVSYVEDLEAAVKVSDIVSCITSSTSPILKGAWLQPGTHIDLVGSYTPEMRESDDETMLCGRLFVDSRGLAAISGDLSVPISNGIITEAAIIGDLYELCSKSVEGRRTNNEITVFKNAGGGHLDLMVAEALYQAAILSKELVSF